MKINTFKNLRNLIALFIFLINSNSINAQDTTTPKPENNFWNKVQFGGGLGLGIGSGYTDITVAPSAIYNFNELFSLGTGLQGSFISQKDFFKSTVVGVNVIGLFNPIEEIQLSLEVEEVNVSTKFQSVGNTTVKNNFWNTGLFIGAGYRTNNVTIGARYNLLFDKDKSVYSDALMPFVRVYF
ncbi:hypothetical protein [Flavobacterium sp.]|uniref:hypothetical protein n=1 Tax=Flavobacterium sp. TaxID=239 RepID=UPI003752308A